MPPQKDSLLSWNSVPGRAHPGGPETHPQHIRRRQQPLPGQSRLQLLSILNGTKLKVPDKLRLHYPELEQIASEMLEAPTLFSLGSPAGRNPRALLLE
jgi:hypothetical protein